MHRIYFSSLECALVKLLNTDRIIITFNVSINSVIIIPLFFLKR